MFIDAAKQTREAELLSVYSRSEETATEFAKKTGAETWYTDLDAMLDGPTDFVYIASPNIMHYDHIIKTIKKGKHVFCEKPLVYTEAQWAEIYKLAKEYSVFVFEGYRHLFSPNYRKLQVGLTEIGEVHSAILHFVQYSSRYDAYKEGQVPNVFSEKFAGGVLMDLGVYPLSMAIDLFGEPVDINYFPVKLSNGIDGSGTLILTYENNVVTILASKIGSSLIPSEIHGEKGTLIVDHIAPISSLKHHDRQADRTNELAEPQYEIDMVYQVEAFIKMVEQNDTESYETWMERSRQVAKWSEKARQKTGILFPGE
jgi:predicted dehydrogenase